MDICKALSWTDGRCTGRLMCPPYCRRLAGISGGYTPPSMFCRTPTRIKQACVKS